MDLGEPFKREIRITPGEDASFIVHVCADTRMETGKVFGFTTIDDLLIWMAKHGSKFSPKQPGVTELKESQIMSGAGMAVDHLHGIRRTSAASAKTLAERVETLGRQHVSDDPGYPTPAA